MFLKDKNSFSVTSADKLNTARTINGTSFNGSANITTANWGTARTLTIGNSAKSVNGSANVSWSLSEIGAAPASHTHSYAPISHEQDYAGTNSNTYIAYPKDGRYRTNTSSITGYLKITLPQTWTSTMMRFEVDVFNYVNNETMTYVIGGYNYNGNSTWINYSAYCISHSGNAKRNLTVRFGHDGTKCAIYIGEASTTWAYTQVTVKNITVGYSNNSLTSWNSGWVVGFTTTLGTVTGTVTNPYVGNGGMASTANTLATARTINGTSFNGSANITTAQWGTARTLTIGNSGKSVNGSGNVSWTLSEIGAAAASHGNHVPAIETANARKFLRNDNTWQTLPSATTSATGIVQLNDATNSTSTTQAATANAVKKAYDRAEQAFQSASDGKTKIATAITGKGVTASSSDSFQVLSDKINQIKTGGDFHADLEVVSKTPVIGGVNVTLNTHDFFKQYQVNGGSWQSSPTFNGLTGAGTYTFRARYDTTTESSNITSCTATLPKGNQQKPNIPVQTSVTENSMTFEARPAPQELWFNGSKATSNTFTGLQTGVAYPAYHRLPATATANEAVSNTVNFYAGLLCNAGTKFKSFQGSRTGDGSVVSVMAVKALGTVNLQGTLTCDISNNRISCSVAHNNGIVLSSATSNYNQVSTGQKTVSFTVGDTFTLKATGNHGYSKFTGILDLCATDTDVLNKGFSRVTVTTFDLLYIDEVATKLVPNEYAVYYYNEDENIVYCEYYKTEEDKDEAMKSYENDDSMKVIKIEHIELNENQLDILNQLNNNEIVLNMLQTSMLPLEYYDNYVLNTLNNIVKFEEDVNEFLNSLEEENKNE